MWYSPNVGDKTMPAPEFCIKLWRKKSLESLILMQKLRLNHKYQITGFKPFWMHCRWNLLSCRPMPISVMNAKIYLHDGERAEHLAVTAWLSFQPLFKFTIAVSLCIKMASIPVWMNSRWNGFSNDTLHSHFGRLWEELFTYLEGEVHAGDLPTWL